MPGVYICPIWPHLYNLRKDLHITLVSTSTPAFVAFLLRLQRPINCLFSRWQRVHGYTSLIRPRIHPSLHSTSTFREHFRIYMPPHSCLYNARRLHTSLFGLISTILDKIYIAHWFLRLRLPLRPSLYVYSGPSLALFSRWQRVHGYTSLIRPRLHPSLHPTSTFREHFRISDNAVNPQTSLFREHLSYIFCHKHFREHLWALNNAICFIWTFSRTFAGFLVLAVNPAYIFY